MTKAVDAAVAVDHLVVVARNLDEGSDAIEKLLGVRPLPGGEHPAMGTHNRLLGLGEGCYLEVIAVNPEAPAPERARWFEMDTDAMRERLKAGPCLVTWALRTREIEALASASAVPLGPVRPMSRGGLAWRLTLTEDGSLPAGGLVPFLIQWGEGTPHPSSRLPDSGCRLVSLGGRHPKPALVSDALASLGASALLRVELSALVPGVTPCSLPEPVPDPPRRLSAVIASPRGNVTLW